MKISIKTKEILTYGRIINRNGEKLELTEGQYYIPARSPYYNNPITGDDTPLSFQLRKSNPYRNEKLAAGHFYAIFCDRSSLQRRIGDSFFEGYRLATEEEIQKHKDYEDKFNNKSKS